MGRGRGASNVASNLLFTSDMRKTNRPVSTLILIAALTGAFATAARAGEPTGLVRIYELDSTQVDAESGLMQALPTSHSPLRAGGDLGLSVYSVQHGCRQFDPAPTCIELVTPNPNSTPAVKFDSLLEAQLFKAAIQNHPGAISLAYDVKSNPMAPASGYRDITSSLTIVDSQTKKVFTLPVFMEA
jgi:hypothetical protein